MVNRLPGSATDPLWFKDAIIYELHVKAFADSNADGIGDFPGLMQKLDYLQDLGVTCIWLLPFFPSPLRDDGYDISDYVNVNPSYGTMEDFKGFLAAAHERELQVMIELVINHTSDQHPWFKAARNAPAGSPERDYYVWSDTDQKYKGARIIFTDTEKSNWTWDPVAKAYFWHRFFSHQPDLNFDNPACWKKCSMLCGSGWIWAWMVCGWTRSLICWSAMERAARICLRRTSSSRMSGAPWMPVIPIAPSWRRQTSGRATCGLTSAKAMSATWRFTFQ